MSMIVVVLLILSIIFLLYGLAIKRIRSGTWFFMVWLLQGVGCFLLALMFFFHVWSYFPRVFNLILLIAFILLCIMLFVSLGFVLTGFYAGGEKNLPYIIVLGAQIYSHGPSVALRFRLDRAYAYLCENPDTICIVSGVQGSNEPFTEAYGMAEYLKEKGIEASRILLEDKSTNTVENIIFSKKLITGDGKVGIVTNEFHIFRSVKIAKSKGLQAVGIASKSLWFYKPNNVYREMLGVIKDFVKGNMK